MYHEIHSVSKYPAGFDDVIDVNHKEKAQQAFPEISSEDKIDLSQYDTIFLGYPVWANTIPRPVATFLRDNNVHGKTVIPFVAHGTAGSHKAYAGCSGRFPMWKSKPRSACRGMICLSRGNELISGSRKWKSKKRFFRKIKSTWLRFIMKCRHVLFLCVQCRILRFLPPKIGNYQLSFSSA